MTHPHAQHVEVVDRSRANLTGLYLTLLGVIIFNLAVFLKWSKLGDKKYSG